MGPLSSTWLAASACAPTPGLVPAAKVHLEGPLTQPLGQHPLARGRQHHLACVRATWVDAAVAARVPPEQCVAAPRLHAQLGPRKVRRAAIRMRERAQVDEHRGLPVAAVCKLAHVLWVEKVGVERVSLPTGVAQDLAGLAVRERNAVACEIRSSTDVTSSRSSALRQRCAGASQRGNQHPLLVRAAPALWVAHASCRSARAMSAAASSADRNP
eukprot:CAMPEP_0196679084 /NCGR_PEP_ID=MMETSP1090-20130531/6805_1 /TAXON_ID=37098 /ORGANISM="Isochrysis sp, Strain CCMP1244" /LENGTH=213 /DNA_ID=CAMNT_0042017277 /DNA_START=121 /DNA_END=763 /DNA_ORIENTATION=+